MWDRVVQLLASQNNTQPPAPPPVPTTPSNSGVRAQKVMPNNDPEGFLNTFEWMVMTAGWPTSQWSAILVPCLIGPDQQSVDTLLLQELCDYKKVKTAVLQTFNLNHEA